MTQVTMPVDECLQRADACAAHAAAAADGAVALEFLTLAAKWRSIACGGVSLGKAAEPPEAGADAPVAPQAG